MRASSTAIAQACAALSGTSELEWEEIGIRLAATVARQAGAAPRAHVDVSPRAVARVTHIVRTIERQPAVPLTLRRLAASVELSPYHFLRTFEQVTGVTPHQYVRRTRLREAARRLALESERIIEIAFESGFGDLSNFNRAFRTEFGVSPRVYRRDHRKGGTIARR